MPLGKTAEMSRRENFRWVWASNEKSRHARQVSILAVAETVVCVATYWSLIFICGFAWEYWILVALTLPMLMRSDYSINKGKRFFDQYLGREPGGKWPLSITSGLSMLTGLASAFFVSLLIREHLSFVEFGSYKSIAVALLGWIAMNGGLAISGLFVIAKPLVTSILGETSIRPSVLGMISVAGTIIAAILGSAVGAPVGEVASSAIGATVGSILALASVILAKESAALVIYSIAFPGMFAGAYLRAMLVRCIATMLHPIKGFLSMPLNWQKIIWVNDFVTTPELVPGHQLTRYGSSISFSRRYASGEAKSIGMQVFHSMAAIVFFTPTITLRWAIKSTAWFYLPFLWVGRGWQRLDRDDLLIWAKSYSTKCLNRIGLFFAALFLTTSLFALVLPVEFLKLAATLKIEGAPMTPLGYVMILDWARLADQPWQWFYLPSWCLTLTMFLKLDAEAKDIAHGAKADARVSKLYFWMWIGNTRTVLTNVGLGIALFYFLDAVDAPAKIVTFWDWLICADC